MDQPDGVRKLLLEKNNFITAMKSEDKKAAIEHLEKMKQIYKGMSGKDLKEIFSEEEWANIESVLGITDREEADEIDK